MNKYLAILLDKIGLLLLHRKKSKELQFKNVDEYTASLDFKRFFTTPSVPDITLSERHTTDTYTHGTYSYRLPDNQYSIVATNRVSGQYFLPVNKGNNIHIVIVHGWRTEDLGHLKKLFLKPFQNAGFSIYFVTLPYHMERSNGSTYSGEYLISANLERTLHGLEQAVREIRALIHWIKADSSAQVVLIGVSLGGYMTNLISLLEEKIDGLISIMYANHLPYEIWYTTVGKYIKQDLVINNYTYEELQEAWAVLDLTQHKPKLAHDRILLISGQYDQYVELSDAEKLWQAWDRPNRIIYPCGHSGIVFCRKQIANDVSEFIAKNIRSKSCLTFSSFQIFSS